MSAVLVVEDDPLLRESLAEYLEETGLDVLKAENGRAALECLEKEPNPCLILLDMAMPVMNGWEFREEQLRRRKIAKIPVVVVSADGRVEEKTRDIGAADGLSKPLDLDRLLSVISRFCRSFRGPAGIEFA
ncbi:MAG TPA: response regulator [Thermoanaerobaculia bacterium]|nr:response regulator [Thermoanaerobaculia bacterium]